LRPTKFRPWLVARFPTVITHGSASCVTTE